MNAFCSVFGQILKLFPRSEFAHLVAQTGAERHARGFTSWQQFVAMLFCQLGRAHSLREICQGLASIEGKINHLGVGSAPSKSTLAYANEHRPWELYQRVFEQLYARSRASAPKHPLRFKNRLLSIDATVIELCASVFDWARYKRTKGAVKLHMILDHNGHLPSFCHVSEARKYDVVVAREVMSFEPGTVIIPWFRPLPPSRTMLVGSRDYSPGERDELMLDGVPLVEPENLTEPNVDRWLSAMKTGADRLLVHVDLDVLDPRHGRANEYAADGGLSPEEILRVIAIARRRFEVVALELASFDPSCDTDGRVAAIGAEIVRAIC